MTNCKKIQTKKYKTNSEKDKNPPCMSILVKTATKYKIFIYQHQEHARKLNSSTEYIHNFPVFTASSILFGRLAFSFSKKSAEIFFHTSKVQS